MRSRSSPGREADRRGRRERNVRRRRLRTRLSQRKGSGTGWHRGTLVRRRRPPSQRAPGLAAQRNRHCRRDLRRPGLLPDLRRDDGEHRSSPQRFRLHPRLPQLRIAVPTRLWHRSYPISRRPPCGRARGHRRGRCGAGHAFVPVPLLGWRPRRGEWVGGDRVGLFRTRYAREVDRIRVQGRRRIARPERHGDRQERPAGQSPVRPCACRYPRSQVARSALRASRLRTRSSTLRRPARRGTFAWDVAPGRWRLRVTAYGYRSFVSKTYKVPPAVTHFKLQLTPDPRTQRLLIDPAGHVGAVQLRRKLAWARRGPPHRSCRASRSYDHGHLEALQNGIRDPARQQGGRPSASVPATPQGSEKARQRRPRGTTASSTRRSLFAVGAWSRSSFRSRLTLGPRRSSRQAPKCASPGRLAALP